MEFVAVFEDVPDEAVRFRLRSQPGDSRPSASAWFGVEATGSGKGSLPQTTARPQDLDQESDFPSLT